MQSLRSRREKQKPSRAAVASESKSKEGRQHFNRNDRIPAVIRGVSVFLVLSLLYFVFWFMKQHKESMESVESDMKAHERAQRESLFKDTTRQIEKLDKNGNVVHRAITSVRKEDLKALGVDSPENVDMISYDEAIKGREEIIEILHDAGVEEIDVATALSLPKWSTVTRLYGDGPVVIGLDTCKRFRETIPLDDASMGVAGMFNTGTNPFAMYLDRNCIMPHNTHDSHGGTRWQVP
jgi:Na+-transporting methylmalonyl-CoA/oxaloacetate decarboxylase gamma subunit